MKRNYVKPQMLVEKIELETMIAMSTFNGDIPGGSTGGAKERFLMQEELDELSRDFGDLW